MHYQYKIHIALCECEYECNAINFKVYDIINYINNDK